MLLNSNVFSPSNSVKNGEYMGATFGVVTNMPCDINSPQPASEHDEKCQCSCNVRRTEMWDVEREYQFSFLFDLCPKDYIMCKAHKKDTFGR